MCPTSLVQNDMSLTQWDSQENLVARSSEGRPFPKPKMGMHRLHLQRQWG